MLDVAAQLEALWDAPVGLALFDAQLRYVRVNAALAAINGVPPEAHVGKTVLEVLPEQNPEVEEQLRRVRDTGIALDVEVAGHTPREPGVLRHWRVSYYPVRDGAQVVGVGASVVETTHQKRVEETLRESEARYRSLFTHMTEAFAVGEVICDGAGTPRDFRLVEMNDAFEAQTGLSRADVQGRPIREVLPRVEQSWIDTYCGVALSGNPIHFESHNRDLDRHFSVYCFSPGPGRFAMVFTDITARKRAEEASARDHELLARLFERLPVLITIYRPALGSFRFNDAFRRVLGWTEEDAAKGDLMALAYPDPAVRTEAAAHMRSVTPGWREFPVRAKDGSVVASTWANLRLADDTQVGIGIDLRAVKRAEDAALHAEQRFRAVVENLPSGLVVADLATHALHWNRQALAIHGYTGEGDSHRFVASLVAEHELRTLDGEAIPVERWPLPMLLRGEPFLDYEVAVRNTRLGWERVFSYSGVILPGVGELPATGLLAIQDVTERRRAEVALRAANERLRDADRRKDEFLGMLSHELRNPLAPIRNALYILDRADPAGAQARRSKEIATRQVAHLTRLVDDLLDVTRIVRGKVQLRRTRGDLAALVRRIVEDHRALMHDRGIALDLAVPAGPVLVDADETRLAQVVGNLLQNAAKFTPTGGRVAVSLDTDGGRAVLRVADSGVGIAPELKSLVFEPFVQAQQTLARSEGGLGLGLALVKGLVALHGGEVTVESEGEGRGATFAVTLPLGRAASAAASGMAAPPLAPARRRVLIVDDNRDAAESLAELVGMLGHEVETAYDGPSAVARAQANPPDVVLCDIGLPGMDGYAVARTLRAQHRHLRLVAVSGYAQAEDLARATEAGFDEHIAKPAAPERIERAIA